MEVSLYLMVFIHPNCTLKPLSHEDLTINEGLVWDSMSGSVAGHSMSCLLPLLFDFELSLKNGLYGENPGDQNVFCLASVAILNVLYFF